MKDIRNLDLDRLERLYAQKALELEKAVLSGAQWEFIKTKRDELVEVSNALHHRLQHPQRPRYRPNHPGASPAP